MDEQLYFLVNECGKCWCQTNKVDDLGFWSIWKTHARKYTREEIDNILFRNLNSGWAKIKAE